jgi:hypothetical protein
MEIFINELSLEGQYFTETEFTRAVRIFNALFFAIHQVKDKEIYKEDSQLLVNYEAIKGSNFMASLNRIKDKSLKQRFLEIVFDKLNSKEWRQDQVHSTQDNFDYVSPTETRDVRNTSLAEAAERRLQHQDKLYLLVNFANSSFNQVHPQIQDCCIIPIVKNNDEAKPINLDGLDNKAGLKQWLEIKFKWSEFEYNESSKNPPTDKQTILRDSTRFEKTSVMVQGRTVYRELMTDRYWYVDNLHIGKAAHLEVFDKTGKHIGEADLQGNLNTVKKDLAKTIQL